MLLAKLFTPISYDVQFHGQACVVPTHINNSKAFGFWTSSCTFEGPQSVVFTSRERGWFVSVVTAACAFVAALAPSGSIAIVVYYNKV